MTEESGKGNRSRAVSILRPLTVVVFALAAVFYVVKSLHWRMAVDTPVMHYVVFLMRHGMKPYSDITDNNMPGAYLTEAAAMRVFGGSDVAWRVYEFFLMGVLAGSCIVIARKRDWVAGVFAAGMFLVLHAAEGPQLAVEREFVIGVLLMAAFAILFESVRRSRPGLMFFFGLLSGIAASIKPTYLPLPAGVLVLAAFALRRRGERASAYVMAAMAGLVFTAAGLVLFLWREHAIPGFVFILRQVLPTYAGLERPPLSFLVERTMPHALMPLVLAGGALAVSQWIKGRRWTWEQWAAASASAFGLLSYFVQGKGFLYHRYVFLLFLLLLIGIEIFAALPQAGWRRIAAVTGLCFALLYIVPVHLHTVYAITGHSDLELGMEHDLTRLGTTAELQQNVQCFDLVYGCLDALYHLDLVEDTGFTGDMLLFTPQPSAARDYYRQRFWTLAKQHPADVLVISNGNFGVENSFNKLQRWLAFDNYLQQQYAEVVERCFPLERYAFHYPQPLPPGDCYRIYIRKNSPLLARAEATYGSSFGPH